MKLTLAILMVAGLTSCGGLRPDPDPSRRTGPVQLTSEASVLLGRNLDDVLVQSGESVGNRVLNTELIRRVARESKQQS